MGRRARIYLINHVNKSLGIFPTKAPHHLESILLREDDLDQIYALLRAKVTSDQPFPGWRVTVDEKLDQRIYERREKMETRAPRKTFNTSEAVGRE